MTSTRCTRCGTEHALDHWVTKDGEPLCDYCALGMRPDLYERKDPS